MIRINLNEYIEVKLTDHGKDIFYHQFDELNERAGREVIKPEYPKENKYGYTSFQLWQFIELYGPYIGMCKKEVIEPLELLYEEEKQ